MLGKLKFRQEALGKESTIQFVFRIQATESGNF
jgi:hypothetical protein